MLYYAISKSRGDRRRGGDHRQRDRVPPLGPRHRPNNDNNNNRRVDPLRLGIPVLPASLSIPPRRSSAAASNHQKRAESSLLTTHLVCGLCQSTNTNKHIINKLIMIAILITIIILIIIIRIVITNHRHDNNTY